MGGGRYSMLEAAKQLKVHKLTLYRWEKKGLIKQATRLRRTNERIYTDADIAEILAWKDATVDPSVPMQQRPEGAR